MSNATSYQNIKLKKNRNSSPEPLSDQEALTRVLDYLDFQASFSSLNSELPKQKDSRPWIELKLIK